MLLLLEFYNTFALLPGRRPVVGPLGLLHHCYYFGPPTLRILTWDGLHGGTNPLLLWPAKTYL